MIIRYLENMTYKDYNNYLALKGEDWMDNLELFSSVLQARLKNRQQPACWHDWDLWKEGLLESNSKQGKFPVLRLDTL